MYSLLIIFQQGDQRGSDKGKKPPQGLGSSVDALIHLPAQTEAGDVMEISIRVIIARALIANAAQVKDARMPTLDDIHSPVELAMDGDGLDQITAGTAGDKPDGNLGSDRTILPPQAVP